MSERISPYATQTSSTIRHLNVKVDAGTLTILEQSCLGYGDAADFLGLAFSHLVEALKREKLHYHGPDKQSNRATARRIAQNLFNGRPPGDERQGTD